MGARRLLSGIAGWLLLGAGGVEAGTLTSATWTQTLSPVSWLLPLTLTRTTAQLGASGTSTATSISVSLAFPQLATSFLTQTTGMAFVFVSITQGGAQAITATPNMASGTPTIPGKWVVGGTAPLLSVPLHHGPPAQITRSSFPTTPNFWIAVAQFYGWAPNTVTVKGVETNTVTTQVVAKGSFDLTASGGGTVTLVAPAKLNAIGGVGDSATRIHSFTTLTLHFVPEPSALLLLAAAAVSLAWRSRGGSARPAPPRSDRPRR